MSKYVSFWRQARKGALAALFFVGAACAVRGAVPGDALLDVKEQFVFGPGEAKSWCVELKPEWAEISVESSIKTDGLVTGKADWMNGRIPMSFRAKDGKQIGGWPNVFGFAGTKDWTVCRRDYAIPYGAVKLNIAYSNFGTAGKASFGPLKVVLKRNRVLKRENVALPEGAKSGVWSIGDAWSRTTPTRKRICLNGLWGWRPALANDAPGKVPDANDCWGWGKIPAVWENAKDTVQDSQVIHGSQWFADNGMSGALMEDAAWYRREFTMPDFKPGERVALEFRMLQTRAVVYVDGNRAAEVVFPGGSADVTKWAKPGAKQSIELFVTAYPLNPQTLEFNAPGRSDVRKTVVKFKGVTGDVYLDVMPGAARIEDAAIETRFGPKRVKFVVRCNGLEQGKKYRLAAKAEGCGETVSFDSGKIAPDADGTLSFEMPWESAKTWDVHTPSNRYECGIGLYGEDGTLLDSSIPESFGFREIRCEGKDLTLNGKKIHLRVLHNTTMNSVAAYSCRETAIEMCRRLKSEGYNAIIAGNYNYSPGAISHFDALMDACDETGMLFSYSLPHIRDFGVRLDKPEVAARYAKLARRAINLVRNRPCVALYAMNHNSTGYKGDMNPLRIDGKYDIGLKNQDGIGDWQRRCRGQARKTAAIVKAIDSTRPVYHHESGNLDDFHTVNIYLNWSPVQERSDWLEHWSKNGVKPLFFVEWGMPHVSSWSSYRGPLFIWRNPGYQSLWACEYAAALLGDAAYEGDTPEMKTALDLEERLWEGAKSKPFLWSQLYGPLRGLTNLYWGVQAEFMADNMRSHRAWGISAMLPWDQGAFFKETAGGIASENPNRWEKLKEPGIVPDYFLSGRWDAGAGDAASFERTSVGNVMKRWNAPECAFIGGDGVFTCKRHNYTEGEKVRKNLILLNDRRENATVRWRASISCGNASPAAVLEGTAEVEAGGRVDVPVEFAPTTAGEWKIAASFDYGEGVVQTDEFAVTVRKKPEPCAPVPGLLLYDPVGLTSKEFDRLGIKYAKTDLKGEFKAPFRLVVGREALTGEALDFAVGKASALQGSVLIFEQNKETLERAGFRVQNYGLRKVFARYRDPLLPEFDAASLRDWSGSSTLLPEHFGNLAENETSYPAEEWAGFTNTRVWRCGNRGTVASVIPEKPTMGDWRALVDGGFDLQYAPLLDWTVGRGRITFCQMDVTARTVNDPAADALVRNLVSRMARTRVNPKWPRAIGQRAWISGRDLMVGIKEDLKSAESGVFIVSSGAEKPKDFAKMIAEGGKALCLGMKKEEIAKWSPAKLEMHATNGCHAARIENPPAELNGLSNADWHWHGAMSFDAFAGKTDEGNAAIRVVKHGKGSIIFWQVPPWKFDVDAKPYLRTSRRRAEWMLSRLLGNMGCVSLVKRVKYLDAPIPEDDPYRYYRW